MDFANVYLGDVDRGLKFAHALCLSAHMPAHVLIAKISGEEHVSIGRWVGTKHSAETVPVFAASAALAEMLTLDNKPTVVQSTASSVAHYRTPAGAARLGEYAVAVSSLDFCAEHAKLLALIVLYSLKYEVRLHTIAARLPSQAEMTAQGKHHYAPGIVIPGDSRNRIYYPEATDLVPNGKFYVRYDVEPERLWDFRTHWDLATTSPTSFLQFLAGSFGQGRPIDYSRETKNDPDGILWVEDTALSGSFLGVAARSKWTPVETWRTE